MRETLAIASTEDVDKATRMVRQFADHLGFGNLDSNLIAAAASELAMNVVLHAGHGVLILGETDNGRGIEVSVNDRGPGIADIERARQKGYSSRPDGLGLGLSAASQAVEQFEITSEPGRGTQTTIRHFLDIVADQMSLGIASMADPAYSCNGDYVFNSTLSGDTRLVAVIDGGGQGAMARDAALCARDSLRSSTATDPCELACEAHVAVREKCPERGFAMALLLASAVELRLVSVGDVACRAFIATRGDEPFQFAEYPGTLGSDMPAKFVEQRFDISVYETPLIVVMATDGVSPRFVASGDPIIGDTSDIAHTILQRFRRAHGDATVAVLRVGS